VVAHLVTEELRLGKAPREAVAATMPRLRRRPQSSRLPSYSTMIENLI
jgi:hypothetical protein